MATNENDNRVRISYGDLQELAKKYDSNEKHNRGSTERDDSPAEGNGRSRRPDKPIYRPGSNRTRGKNYSTGDSHHYANASEDRISRSGKSDINYEVREISQRLDQMTASARSNDSGHGDNNHHGDRNKFKQNKFGSRRPDRSLYVPKGVRQSQVPGTSGDKEQQYDKEMQDQFALPGEEESWEDDVDQHIMSNDHDGNDQVTDGGGHLEADRQLTGDVKPGAGKEQMVSKGKGRGRGKRVPQQTDEVVTKDNNNSDREHSDHSRDSLDWDYHPSENYQFVNSQFGSGTRSGGAGVYNGTESQQSSRGRGRRKGTRRERTEASYRGDSRDDDDGGHLERSESYHGNMKARPPANRNRNQPPYRQRENSQSQEECEAEYKDLSDKIDQLSSDYQKRTGSLQRDSSWGKSQSRRSGSQERKDYRPPPRSGSRESIQTDYNRQRSGSFDYSATRHSKGRHHDHNSYSGYPGDSLSPTRQRKGINNQAYSHHDDEPTYTSPRRASSETKEKVPLLPDPPGHRRRNDSELSWGEQIEQEEEEERMKQEQHKLEESKQPRHYRMPDQHRSMPEHRTRSYSEQSDEHLGGNDRGSSGRWHGGGGGYHDNRYHDNRGYRDNYKDNHYSDRRGGYNSNTRGSRSGSEGPARPQRPNSAESRSGSAYSTDNKGGYRQRYDSGGDGRSTNSPASSNTHTGGILRLPPNAAAAAMGKPVVHNPHYPPPSMSHSTHQQPAATQSSVRGEISGNHQLYDPNNPNASHPNTQGQRGKTNNPPPPSQHYHGTKPLQFQEQPMYSGDSAAPQTNGPTSPGYVVSSPPYGHPPPPGGQYPGYTATAPPPPFYGHPAMYPPMYMDPAYAGQRPPVDQNHMIRFQQLMMELHPALLELSAFVAHYQQGTLTLYPQILESKQKVQQLCVQIVLADLQYCQDNSMDRVMWKWCFHVIIEALRMQDTNHQKCLQQIKNSNEDTTTQEKVIEETHKRLLDILDEATKFYEAFLEQLQSSYHFKLDDLLNPSIFTIESTSHSVKQIKYIVQQVLLCLGDIARYRVQATKSSNYAKPKNWYTKARQVLPKNSRPYNQLAIIAQYTRRKLDAVYFYIRSIEAQNSYHPARENLLSLFEDARKKSKASEELARSEREARELMTTQCKQGGTRQETWVHPDGSKQKEDLYKRSLATGGVDVDHLKQLSPVELNNRFIVSFLNVHGKLFTAVGLDSYDDACLAMLHEFRVLLQHSPSPLSHTRLVQLMAINMYMISNTTSKDPNLAENVRPVAQEHAVQLALDMFAILAIQSMAQVKSHQAAPHGQILSDDLHQLIPSIKVFADWMTCHSEVWNPPPLGRDPESGMNIDVWKAVADLCNVVAALDISHVKLYDQKKDSCDPVILQEDQMLEGFVPLFKLYNPPKWVHSTVDKDVARDCLQVDKLCVFAEWLCGIDEPLLCYNVAERRYVSCAPTFVEKAESTTSSTTKSSDVVVESSPSDSEDSSQRSPVPDLHPDDTTSTAFSDLVTKHAELKDRKNQLDKKQKFLKAVLEDKPRYIELEIHPIFLIADTNCWVDELKELQALLNCGKFTVILPLMVLFELDGLSSESPTHGTKSPDLHNKARHAVSFLEAEFQKSSHPYLKAVTSQGSVLDSITFRSETHNDKCTNDDVILNCCTFYCKDNAREFMPHDKDEAITLYREVVLLTSDVNLRVKAHLRNIPTKSVTAFMHWSKVT